MRSIPHALADWKMEGPWEKGYRQPLRAEWIPAESQQGNKDLTRTGTSDHEELASAYNLDELGR